MMLASSARVSQWTVQKLSSTASNTSHLFGEAARNHIVPLPVWAAATRRFQHSQHTVKTHYLATDHHLRTTCKRHYKNVSRLYARRVLEIAAASAATQRFVAQLEQHHKIPPAMDRPSDWHNWERKEWAEELLESTGSSSIARFWSAVSRLVSLAAIAAPMAVLVPASYVSDQAHVWSWKYALWGIEQAGPTFLKLVQWATTRYVTLRFVGANGVAVYIPKVV